MTSTATALAPALAPVLSPALSPDSYALIAQASVSHRRQFTYAAYNILHSIEDAEDVVQEAMLAACAAVDRFRGESSMVTWLTTIVRNEAYMYLRYKRCSVRHPDYKAYAMKDMVTPIASPAKSIEQLLVIDERDRQINEAIASLPLKYKSAIARWMCTDGSHGSECLNNTQRTHKHRAIILLKQRLNCDMTCASSRSVVG